jgi:hypothetical protein
LSIKVYEIIAVNSGHDRFDARRQHSRERADAFLQTIGHRKHTYRCELSEHAQRLDDSAMVIFANESGAVVRSFS